ncbi:MAG: gamma-glutamylcyclotransferase [Firmicutes bacterium]|nr:gamma-glutamylcyclotransferase [Bacillota bacterium]
MNNKKLYAAYGSNLNLRQMSVRCPDAVPVGTAMLKDWQLTFRGVATLEPSEGAETPVGIWEITPQCEVSLDRYEGFPRLYRKAFVEVELKGKTVKVMLYLMNDGMPCLPSKWYLDAIAQGYEDVGLDTVHLTRALEHTSGHLGRRKK